MIEKWITTKEYAEKMEVTVQKVYNQIKKGKVRSQRTLKGKKEVYKVLFIEYTDSEKELQEKMIALQEKLQNELDFSVTLQKETEELKNNFLDRERQYEKLFADAKTKYKSIIRCWQICYTSTVIAFIACAIYTYKHFQ